ncbi:hypothetical protein [Labilibacter marinus]|uniref:hypothetical protein n=1 Tax=Labilibacter marinus TaxID=1477105 RepID=UPI00094FB6A7|nr:hypothetical protein [Labilibacter marinus]
MKKLLLLNLATLFINLSYSQSKTQVGFIIQLNGDTIHGEIENRSNIKNAEQCKFYSKNGSFTYNANEIKEYNISNQKYYISKSVKLPTETQKETYFLEFLVKGTANLYYLKRMHDEYFFIEKDSTFTILNNNESIVNEDDGSTYAKESKQYIGAMIYAFQDAPQLRNKIKNSEFYYKPLIKIVKEYNTSVCGIDDNCIEYKKDVEDKVYLEVLAGYNSQKLTLNSSSQSINSNNLTFGANFAFTPLKSHYVWNFISGIEFSNFNSSQNITDYTAIPNDFVSVEASFFRINIPIKVRYTLPLNRFRSFISAGINNSFIASNKSTMIIQRTQYTKYNKDTKLSTYQLFYSLEAGLKIPNQKNNYWITRLNYDIKNSNSFPAKSILDDSSENRIMFTLGYAFIL